MKKIDIVVCGPLRPMTYGQMVERLRQKSTLRAMKVAERDLAANMIENLCAEVDALYAEIEKFNKEFLAGP